VKTGKWGSDIIDGVDIKGSTHVDSCWTCGLSDEAGIGNNNIVRKRKRGECCSSLHSVE
jgi:hypothetical protein